MPTQELKDFVEERLRAYDPNIDLTEGAPAQLQVVDPIVSRFQPDPFEMSIEKFILARLTQEFPEVNFREGSGIYDFMAKAGSVLFEPISREVQLIKQGQSFARPDILAPTEADALAANLFISRSTGGLSVGRVRLYFNAPLALNVSAGNVCYTADGLRYIPTYLQSITAESMLFNQSGNLYYFDIQVTAEEAGASYNVDKKKIVGITNLNSAVLVENVEKFEGGLDDESTPELVDKAETSITERSLVVARGVSARLHSAFEDLVHLQVVGMFDEEMSRDIIKGGDLGEAVVRGTDGYTEDDGDGDAYTYILRSRYADFTDYFGAVGDLSQPHYLLISTLVYGNKAEVSGGDPSHIIVPDTDLRRPDFILSDAGNVLLILKSAVVGNVGPAKVLEATAYNELHLDRMYAAASDMAWALLRPIQQIEIDAVLSPTELRVKSPLPINRQSLFWSIHPQHLTLSDIPGGVLYTDDAASLEIKSDEIHVGGAADFYVRGTAVENRELVIPAISDETPLDKGLDLMANTTYVNFVRSPAKDFVTLGVKAGMSLVIETGANAQTRTILRVGVRPAGVSGPSAVWLQVDPVITSTDGAMRYKIVDNIEINLRQPKTVRGTGDDLETLQLSPLVTTTSAVDFSSIGASENDTLEILEGLDKGTYTVSNIGGTGNRDLIIGAQLRSTTNNLSWSLYKAQEGIEFPLVRITSIDILDSSSQPTGFTVPYAPPIDARSSSFSNAGRGTKVSTSDAITGIVASVSMDDLSYPLGATVLRLKVNDSTTYNIDLTGQVSKDAVIQTINNKVPDVAAKLTIDGKEYLTIRSSDRWLEVSSNYQNANLGLNVAGEDNRQIRSAGNITDWTAYDLRAQKDAVYIKTGDNIGYLYLISVSATKVYAVGFDETRKTVRFLQPNTRVSLVAGARSYGKARVYFLDPTSFTVRGAWHPSLAATSTNPANKAVNVVSVPSTIEDEDPMTYFTATVNGTTLRFFPDPDLKHELLPAPDEDISNNLTTASGSPLVRSNSAPASDLGKNSRATELDFLKRELRINDELEVTYQPIQATADISVLTPPFSTLQGKTLILTLGDNPTRTITFTDQLTSLDDVLSEINEGVGQEVAFIETISTAQYLRLEADDALLYHYDSTAKTVFWTSPPAANVDNYAEAHRTYQIIGVGHHGDPTLTSYLAITPVASGAGDAQHFKVYRPGVQRLHSTVMNENLVNGLYYMDVELVSEGVGNEWNLQPGLLFQVVGYESDGYYLEVADTNLSFSEEEQVKMVLSKRLLTVGSSDRPDEATPLSEQNIQISYERSPITSSIQSFARSELERVLTASLLVRHLQPHYLNFELNYRGGSSSDIVMGDVQTHLAGLGPNDRVEVSDIQDLARRRSASYIQNPMELVAVVHGKDRKISVDRSEDYVSKGRLATFFPGSIRVTRDTTSVL